MERGFSFKMSSPSQLAWMNVQLLHHFEYFQLAYLRHNLALLHYGHFKNERRVGAGLASGISAVRQVCLSASPDLWDSQASDISCA